MNKRTEVQDRNGVPVRVGTFVRVLALAPEFIASLPEDERAQVREMIGGTFAVDEIDKWGSAWVTKWWTVADGEYDAHGIGLSSSEMEVVNEPQANAPSPAA